MMMMMMNTTNIQNIQVSTNIIVGLYQIIYFMFITKSYTLYIY